jgi:Ankyrin repeats (3 copies)
LNWYPLIVSRRQPIPIRQPGPPVRSNFKRFRVPILLSLPVFLAWYLWGGAQANHGVAFDWSEESGFRYIDACPESSKFSRILETPFCFSISRQAKRFVVKAMHERGWTKASGALGLNLVPFTPIVKGVYFDGFVVFDPTVTDLMRAAKNGDPVEVKRLIQNGANVTDRDQDGQTALSFACEGGAGNLEVLRNLVAAGAEVNSVDRAAWTPLHVATATGVRLACLSYLLSHGANPNARNSAGDTPLILAADGSQNENDALEACWILIAAGADVSLKNNKGESALDIAKHGGAAWSRLVALLSEPHPSN